ncbi:MAG: DUF6599 family protein [Candidatus Hydrogenedentes bacterium]|nr:DUF6599 family protein [Candidatus Hydrogenedentota bacterium]
MPRWFISSRDHKVFTDRKRKVLRKRISTVEIVASAIFGVAVVVMGVWFLSKKEDFDPGERDISMALLEEGTVHDTLYRTPLLRWVDPATLGSGGAANAPAVEMAPFPNTILDAGWTPSSRLQHFTAENLYEKINGAADQFFQFGFVQMDYISLAKEEAGHDLSIELYDMGALPNALGIFAAQRDETAKIVSTGAANYYPTSAGAIGIAGPYYFKVSGNSDAPEIQEKAKQLAGTFADMAGEGALPAPYTVLANGLKVPFDGIQFEKSDVFQYDFAKDFWFGTSGSDSVFRYYMHEAASPDEATALFDKLLENQLFDYDEVSRTESEVVLKHKVLDAYLSLGKQNNFVYGVDGAPETAVLEQASTLLRSALDDLGDGYQQTRGPGKPEQSPQAEAPEDEAYSAS